jgi:hypothetical protein
MNDAVLDVLISIKSFAAVSSPDKSGTERSILTLAECAALFPSDRDELVRIWGDAHHATAFLTLMSTGIRSGALRALLRRSQVRDR